MQQRREERCQQTQTKQNLSYGLCGISLTSQVMADRHLRGKKHQRNLQGNRALTKKCQGVSTNK